MLVQIGAFSLSALLPAYIDQWHLTKTEAGSLVGIFFAAYVIAVPLLVARHSDFDGLIPSQLRIGKFSGGTRISILLGAPA